MSENEWFVYREAPACPATPRTRSQIYRFVAAGMLVLPLASRRQIRVSIGQADRIGLVGWATCLPMLSMSRDLNRMGTRPAHPMELIWSIREVFVFQYRIIYEILASEIHVLTVVHGKRIIEDLI